MELSFVKEGGKYSAEFEVTADFNLHIERDDNGFLFVQQRTASSGQYDSIQGANFTPSDLVIDIDFVGAVYPKWIKIVSEAEPTMAVVNFNA
jgi:hypothetical protein